MILCDSCLDAFNDEGLLDMEGIEDIVAELGWQIPDHRCERVDEPSIRCACSCYSGGDE